MSDTNTDTRGSDSDSRADAWAAVALIGIVIVGMVFWLSSM